MKACPLKTNRLNTNIEKVGRLLSYKDFCETGEIRSPYEVQNKVDSEIGITPGVRQMFECNQDRANDFLEVGSLTQYSAYLKSKGITRVLFDISDKNIGDTKYGNGFYSENGEGLIPIGVKMSNTGISEYRENGDDLKDISDIMDSFQSQNFDSIRMTNISYSDGDLIYCSDKFGYRLLTDTDLEDFREFVYMLHTKNDEPYKKSLQNILQKDCDYLTNDDVEELNDVCNNPLENKTDIKYKKFLDGDTENYNSDIASMEVILKTLKERFDIDYEVIEEDEAKNFLEKSDISDIKAFYRGGKAYFIKGKINSQTAFHEYCHPFLQALKQENIDLYHNLFNELSLTEEGKQLISQVKEKYPDLENDDLIEECLAHSITSTKNIEDLENKSGGFKNFIKNLFNSLKRLFKNLFGKKIDLSNLSSNTSLSEITDIFLGDNKVDLSKIEYNANQLPMYFKHIERELNADFEEFKRQGVRGEITNIIDNMFESMKFLNSSKGRQMLEEVISPTNRYQLEKVYKTINSMRSDGDISIFREWTSDDDKMEGEVKALINSLLTLDDILENSLEKNIKRYSKLYNEDSLKKATYYKNMIDKWEKMLDDIDERAESAKLDRKNALRELVSDMKRSINTMKEYINDIFSKSVSSTLIETLSPMMDRLNMKHQKTLEFLENNNSPQWRIDQEYKEFYGMTKEEHERYVQLRDKENPDITEQKELIILNNKASKGIYLDPYIIQEFLKGNMGDINYFWSMLDSYLQNVDPVVGGFSLFLKNQINDALEKTQSRITSFTTDIKPLLDQIGYNPNRLNELRDKICFRDSINYYNPRTKQYEKREVWSLLHQYKDWRYEKSVRENEIEDLKQQFMKTNTDADKKAYLKAKYKYDYWKRKFFYGAYTDKYNDRWDIFYQGENDEVGLLAYSRLQEVYAELGQTDEFNATGIEDIDSMLSTIEVSEAYQKSLVDAISELASEYDVMGNQKTGQELEIAHRIGAFFESSKDMRERYVDDESLLKSYQSFLKELHNKCAQLGYDEDSDYFKERVEKWINIHSKYTIDDSFYQHRNELYQELEEIMSTVRPISTDDKDIVSDLWRRVSDICAPIKTTHNIYNGKRLAQAKRAELKNIQEQIESLKIDTITGSSLTTEEQNRMNGYIAKFNAHIRLTSAEQNDYEYLKIKRRTSSLSPDQLNRVKAIFYELSNMSSSLATDEYIDTINGLIADIPLINRAKFNSTYGVDPILTRDTVELFLNDLDVIDELSNYSPEFKNFMEDNHIRVKKKVGGVYKNVYKRLHCWSFTKPSDDSYLVKYDVKDQYGNVEFTLNGTPISSYYKMIVKSEYLTPKEIGITKDNQGGWLPKSKEDMANVTGIDDNERYRFINEKYEALKQQGGPYFDLLEKTKEHHISAQQGVSYMARLYYDVPRFENNDLEKAQRNMQELKDPKSLLSKWSSRVKGWIFGTTQDVGDLTDFDSNFLLQRADLFSDEQLDIPIQGLSDIEDQYLSADIFGGIMRYMMSLEKQKSLVAASPLAKALKQVLLDSDNAVKDKMVLDKNSFLKNIIRRVAKYDKDQQSNRFELIDILIDREFQGIKNDKWSNNMMLNKAMSFLMKKASFSYFALNIPSALKNIAGMKFNYCMEGMSGQYITSADLAKGEMIGSKLAFMHMKYINDRGPKPLELQVVDLFDPQQDKFKNDMGKNMTRTRSKTIASGDFFMDFRRLTDYQSHLQFYGALMNATKIKRVDENGNESVIRYLDAWELDENGVAKLKDGIDVRYNRSATYHSFEMNDTVESLSAKYHIPVNEIEQILKQSNIDLNIMSQRYNSVLSDYIDKKNNIESSSDSTDVKNLKLNTLNNSLRKILKNNFTIKINNTKFKQQKNLQHGVLNHQGGAFASFDQPAFNRNILFRSIYFLRKFFPGMFDNRWRCSGITDVIKLDKEGNFDVDWGRMHGSRNYATQDVTNGAYITTFKFLASNLQHGIKGEGMAGATADEKAAMIRTATEMALLILIGLTIRYLFGFDNDDDDKYKKLKKKSGALPIPFIVDKEKSKNFDALGWTELHALNLLLQIENENQQFTLLTKAGLKNYAQMADFKSIFLGPTVDNALSIYGNILGDEGRTKYSRSVGPYIWQQKDTTKTYNFLFKMLGINGTHVDPTLAIQNLVSMSQRSTSR